MRSCEFSLFFEMAHSFCWFASHCKMPTFGFAFPGKQLARCEFLPRTTIQSDFFSWEKWGQFLGTLTLLCQRATLSGCLPAPVEKSSNTRTFILVDEISNCCSLTSFWLHLVFSFISFPSLMPLLLLQYRVEGCQKCCELRYKMSRPITKMSIAVLT